MNDAAKKLKAETALYYSDPSLIHGASLDVLEEALDNTLELRDPTNPFVWLMVSSAVMASGSALKAEGGVRPTYPVLAQGYEDLYNHMSDNDYLDLFASPASAVITLVLPLDTTVALAVKDPTGVLKRHVIPAETDILVAGTHWCTMRPIHIAVSPNNTVQVYYDNSFDDPLNPGGGTVVNYHVTNDGTEDKLVIELPVKQVFGERITESVSIATGFNYTHPIADKFLLVKAFHQKNGGAWFPMETTLSGLNYDVTIPTLQVKVSPGKLEVKLPEVYLTNQSVGDNIRLDIYTTVGGYSKDLSDYQSDDYDVHWNSFADRFDPRVISLSSINDAIFFSNSIVSGGRDELSYSEVRNRVIYRSNDRRAMITFQELSFGLRDLGYSMYRTKNTVTDKLFICGKRLPASAASPLSSGIGVLTDQVTIDTEEFDMDPSTIIKNGGRITVTPEQIYRNYNGISEVVRKSVMDNLRDMSPEDLADELNRNVYIFGPYHYVLDTDGGLYTARVYDLTAPTSDKRKWLASNEASPYVLQTKSVTVTRVGPQYKITIVVIGPENITGFGAQLRFIDVHNQPYHITVEESNRTETWFDLVFTIDTTLDIDGDDNLRVNSMLGKDGDYQPVDIPITGDFDVFYLSPENSNIPIGGFDGDIAFTGRQGSTGISRELIEVSFGKRLHNVACRSHAVLIPAVPLQYHEDIPELHDRYTYKRDSSDKLIWTVGEDGKPVFEVLTKPGDPKIGSDGEPVYYKRVGEPMVDRAGKLMLARDERYVWSFTPITFDARYMFATTNWAETYVADIPRYIGGFLDELGVMDPSLLEETTLLYQPIRNMGEVLAVVDGELTVLVSTAVSFTINYMLTPIAYADESIRSRITSSTKAALAGIIRGGVLSTGAITRVLMVNGGADVIDVTIGEPIGQWSNARILDEGREFSIATESKYTSTGKVDIVESIQVSFYTDVT